MSTSVTEMFVTEVFETDPVRAFSALHHLPYSILFDSADLKHPAARYSFIACEPVETIEAKDGLITVTNAEKQHSFHGDPFAAVRERMAMWAGATKPLPHLPPFQGGAAGFFGYDLGRQIETLPETARNDAAMPDMAIGIYDQVLAFDHLQQKAWLITHAPGRAEARIRQRSLLARLVDAGTRDKPYKPVMLDWEPNFDPFDYKANVRKVIEYIKAGDLFQANIAQRFDAPLPENFCAFAHYKKLRTVNPAPFAAYMNAGDAKISSASPERFLTVSGGAVETRPIKGTRPRGIDAVQDKVYKAQLENSAKDRAENTMIVDLLRNDLSKVCAADSIEVAALCRLESFASVHHLVSTIRGRLREGEDCLSLLRACFPGGSITGAPKIRAMEIIEEMETERRGPYCGSMGYIGFDGNMDSSILIRTLVYDAQGVHFQTGGGITAESDADAEYQETFDKADALFRSFEDDHEIEAEYLGLISAE